MLNIIAFTAVALGQAPALKCPVMGGPVVNTSNTVEYAGSKYSFCCPNCDSAFTKTPAKFVLAQAKTGNTTGVFLFDPVSHNRLDLEKAKEVKDFGGTRYPFESKEDLAKFEKSPAKFAAIPKQEALYCPVSKEKVESYSKASDYADHDGIRFYFCCPGCSSKFLKDPEKYLAGENKQPHRYRGKLGNPDAKFKLALVKEFVKIPAVINEALGSKDTTQSEAASVTKVKFDKYEAELRLPEAGLFAGEEVDVEFRVVDTTQKDAIEQGFKGVGAIEATAVMTMPSMLGMPEAKPKVHREGVPGEYGIELYFPHGGDFKIDLALDIPGQGVKNISFKVDVKDERSSKVAKVQPYRLEVVDWPKMVMAGEPTELKMRVVDTKTGIAQTTFDEAHTKFFHLMIASKDLNWFVHEHPEMSADGTWSIKQTFPAGGQYWVYGDVAPSGKGSRVLISKVSVMGDKPTWDTTLRLSRTTIDGGLKGELSTLEPIQIGRRATIQVKLFDAGSGQPAGDTEKWLGAAGHMMIFHQDGQTVVHSHPAEDAENNALVKQGVVRFSGRFPKPGLYKVYVQFDWHGAVRTLGFAVEVK